MRVGYIGASGSPHTGIENRQARKEALRFRKTDKKESQVGDSRESLVPRIRHGTGGPTPEGPAMRTRFENDYRKSLNLLRKCCFSKRKKVSPGGLTSAPDHIFSNRRVRTRMPGGVGGEQPVRAAPIPIFSPSLHLRIGCEQRPFLERSMIFKAHPTLIYSILGTQPNIERVPFV